MKKMTIMSLVFIVLFSTVGIANAQTNAVQSYVEQQRKNLMDFREDVATTRENMTEKRKTLRSDIKESRDTFKIEIETERTDYKERLQNAETQEERNAILEEAKKAREEMREEIGEVRSSFKEQAKAILITRVEFVIKRIKAFLQRAQDIGTRINNKLDELEADGINVDKERDIYEKAKVLFNDTENKIQEAYSIYTNIDLEIMDKDAVKNELKKIKELLQETRTTLKEGYEKLREIVKNLKENRLIKITEDEEKEENTDIEINDTNTTETLQE